jgi:hypothetical protein
MRQRIQQAAHPRGRDRQRAARRPRIKTQVQLTLPGRQLLPRRRLQQLHLSRGMRRAQMLDLPRPAMAGVHDLHRGGPGGRLHRPDIGHAANTTACD